MNIEEATQILNLHQQWRKGAEIPMQDNVKLGMAIDIILCELRGNIRKEEVKICGQCTKQQPTIAEMPDELICGFSKFAKTTTSICDNPTQYKKKKK